MTLLRARRIARNLTLEDLAKSVGCSKANLGRIEKRQQGASLELVLAIQEVLGLDDSETVCVMRECSKATTAEASP